jgi:hypothetical protein
VFTAAAPPTAIDAERAFAADAQTLGQWTAFRRWAAPGAILFTPQPTDVHKMLEGSPDPALTYQWWPAQAFLSCDGNVGVTTGPSVRGRYRGYFTTIWVREPDGAWKWILDHGDGLSSPRPAGEQPRVRRASCSRLERPGQTTILTMDAGGATRIGGGGQKSEGSSADGSFRWSWQTREDGSRRVQVLLWNGARHEAVLTDEVAGSAR